MLTLENLKAFGANTQEGLSRCLNNEEFYLKMINIGINDAHFSSLQENLKNNNLEQAFEDAHALKGSIGNLAITPLYEPIVKITELLRAKTSDGCDKLCEEIIEARNKLLSL